MSTVVPGDITISELAWLSSQVYYDAGAPGGWKRIEIPGATFSESGFYGAAYQKGSYVVIAFRGTSDLKDGVDDYLMAPNIDPSKAKPAVQEMMAAYGVPKGHIGTANVGHLAEFVFRKSRFSNSVSLGQTLPAQDFLHKVRQFCAPKKLIIRCFTGHSLGGAIAQYAAENTGSGGACNIPVKIPAVAFNSPNMGTMRYTRKGQGGGIVIVNARLDPLSLATRVAGNESHATNEKYEFSLDVDSYAVKPPELPPAPTPEQSGTFTAWFRAAAGHYHNMTRLARFLNEHDPGKRPLSGFFPVKPTIG